MFILHVLFLIFETVSFQNRSIHTNFNCQQAKKPAKSKNERVTWRKKKKNKNKINKWDNLEGRKNNKKKNVFGTCRW